MLRLYFATMLCHMISYTVLYAIRMVLYTVLVPDTLGLAPDTPKTLAPDNDLLP